MVAMHSAPLFKSNFYWIPRFLGSCRRGGFFLGLFMRCPVGPEKSLLNGKQDV
jgi:hypothetical protein